MQRMRINRLNIALVLGFAVILVIVTVQLLWTREAFSTEGKKFSEKVHISLLRSIEKLYEYHHTEFPLVNPIRKISNDYYIVNVNNDFDAEVLEYCLKSEFRRSGLLMDFEYAVYKCESDEMVYGRYVSLGESNGKTGFSFPKQKGLVYYFAIRFPNERGYLLRSMSFWILMSALMLVVLLVYIYSAVVILKQKKYSGLQKDFINNMTHEFKTPLSSVMIAATYLSKQNAIRDDEKLERYTRMIIEQGSRLNEHIEKILNVARTDHSPLAIDLQSLVPAPAISTVSENIRLKHEELLISIDDRSDGLAIQADAFHFSNLVYNLVDNSLKYSEQIPEVAITISKARNFLKIEFADNGIGISDRNKKGVFNKFYRIPGKKSNELNGFGLGLYYVKKICDLHSWRIEVYDNDKKGTTFTLLIPIK